MHCRDNQDASCLKLVFLIILSDKVASYNGPNNTPGEKSYFVHTNTHADWKSPYTKANLYHVMAPKYGMLHEYGYVMCLIFWPFIPFHSNGNKSSENCCMALWKAFPSYHYATQDVRKFWQFYCIFTLKFDGYCEQLQKAIIFDKSQLSLPKCSLSDKYKGCKQTNNQWWHTQV